MLVLPAIVIDNSDDINVAQSEEERNGNITLISPQHESRSYAGDSLVSSVK